MIGRGQRHWVITRRGATVRPAQDGNRENITIIDCVNASGTKTMPPTIVFKGKYHMEDWYTTLGGNDSAFFGVTERGWTNNDLGEQWARKFDAFSASTNSTKKQEPRLFIFNGYESHISAQFLECLLTYSIELLCMPPHSTHLLQPLDVGIFGPLQQRYATNAAKILHSIDYQLQLSKAQFYTAFMEAHRDTFTISNIVSAWKKSGYIPYNP